jgi:hypothetical protein
MLIALGAVLVVAGLLWPWLKKMHLLHLPGDFVIDRPGFKFFLPITTMLMVSAKVLTGTSAAWTRLSEEPKSQV